MQFQLPKNKPVLLPSPRKKTPVPNPAVDVGTALGSLHQETYLTKGYQPERGLYFAGRRPSCKIIGLGRSNASRLEEIDITATEQLLSVQKFIRENKQGPYSLFVIDASYQDAVSAIGIITRETAGNKLYFDSRSLVSVVEKGVEGLLSGLKERYSGIHLRFIEAKKYGSDIIDAQLFG